MADVQETTRILVDLRRGVPGAADRLLPLVYEELRAMADAQFRRHPAHQTLQPTALVHEAFLKLVEHTDDAWQNRTHFVKVASKAMRQILIDHARARHALKRGGGQERVTLAHVEAGNVSGPETPGIDVLALHEALERLAGIDARQAQVVEWRFFGGLSVKETAEALGVSERTIKLDWRMAKAWLSSALSEADE